MALSIPSWLDWRRRRILPMPGRLLRGRPSAPPPPPLAPDLAEELPPDDYLVEGEELPVRPTPASQLVQGIQFFLIVLMAVLSLSIFYLLGVVLNLF